MAQARAGIVDGNEETGIAPACDGGGEFGQIRDIIAFEHFDHDAARGDAHNGAKLAGAVHGVRVAKAAEWHVEAEITVWQTGEVAQFQHGAGGHDAGEGAFLARQNGLGQ